MSKMISNPLALSILLVLVMFISSTGSTCSGKNYKSVAAAYLPQGSDCKGNKLLTLEDYLSGNADHVTVALDRSLQIKYGTQVCIPELNEKYNRQINFRVDDCIVQSPGKGYGQIDICVNNLQDASNPESVTLVFPDLVTGVDFCD